MMIKGSLLSSTPIVKRFQSKKTPILSLNLTVLGDKYGFKIKFVYYPKRHIKISLN